MTRTLEGDQYEDIKAGIGLDPEEVALQREALEALLYQSEIAREDIKEFFNFVMRHETTGEQLVCAPHQRVLFDFVMHHPRCVLRLPVGTSKTFSMAALTLFFLGNDVSQRGAIVSDTQGQAQKPLGMVRDLIETSQRLKMVFPLLRKSQRKTDSWTINEITVERPPGIRDASLVAVGIDGALSGARLSWCIVDDILSRENTATLSAMTKTHEWFDSTVLSRMDPENARIVVCNTPWHPEDLTYCLERAGWPTLTMDVEGNIKLSNCDDFDSPDIRPSSQPGEVYRLTAHDRTDLGPDTDEMIPLWPARYSRVLIAEERKAHLPHRFNQLFLCICRDDVTARCKLEWIEACKTQGKGLTLVSEYTGQNFTATGLDLAVGQGKQHDLTAFFTFEHHPSGKRQILDIEFGQFDAPTIIAKAVDKVKRYKSIIRVENNASQAYILQFARALSASIPIKAHTTGRNKAHPEYGVEGLFIELQNTAWIIPCDQNGRCHPAVQKFIDECLYYQPDAHTGDVLMAAWFAREQAREFGLSIAGQKAGGKGRSIAASTMMR